MDIRNVAEMGGPQLFQHGRRILARLENVRPYAPEDQQRMMGATRDQMLSEAASAFSAAQTAAFIELLLRDEPNAPTAEAWREALLLPFAVEKPAKPGRYIEPGVGDTIAVQDDKAFNGWRVGVVERGDGGDLEVGGRKLERFRDTLVLREASYELAAGAMVAAFYKPDEVFHVGQAVRADDRFYISGYGIPLDDEGYGPYHVLEPPQGTSPAPSTMLRPFQVGDTVVGHHDGDSVHGVVVDLDGDGELGLEGTPLADFESITLIQRADS